MIYTGNDGSVKIGADKVTYIDNWTLSIAADTAETNELGARAKKSIYTSIGSSGSFGGTLDLSDTAQVAILDMFMDGGTLAASELHLVIAEGTVTDEEFTGSALITSVDVGDTYGDKVTFGCNYQFSGEVTHNTKSDV